MTTIDKIDAARFSSSMLPVEDLYFGDDGHTVPTATGWQERWKKLYLPYLHYYKGQVVPMNGSEWRFLRYDAYNRFKALNIDEIRSIVCDFVSIKMIGSFPLVHDAALSNEKLSYLFYCFYAPYTTFVYAEGAPSIKIDQDYISIIFLHRSNAEAIVTRKICGLLRTYETLASMEVSVPKSEDEDRNNKLGGVYQRLEPKCCRILLREGKRLVSKILKDFPLIDEVFFADLGSGMNLVPLYASSMFAWKALGIEVVQNRIHLAAEGHLHLMDHECNWFQKLRVGMYHKNLAKESENWAGIVCYLCWDLVFVDNVVEKIFENIEASMQHDVVLILSKSKKENFKYRRQLMDDMFLVVEEGENMVVSISGGGSDTLQAFRLRKKPPMAHIEPIKAHFHENFDYSPSRKIAWGTIKDEMDTNMAKEKGGRKVKKQKTGH